MRHHKAKFGDVRDKWVEAARGKGDYLLMLPFDYDGPKFPRRTWEELEPYEQASYDDALDLQDGETMHDWWEIYQDALAEDGVVEKC